MSNRLFCQKCWTPIEVATATECPVCGVALVESDPAPTAETVAPQRTEVPPTSYVSDPSRSTSSLFKPAPALAVVLFLAMGAWLLRGVFIPQSFSADDFTGERSTNKDRLFRKLPGDFSKFEFVGFKT